MEEVPAAAREVPALAGRLLAGRVELVVMEATSDYRRIWYYLLEGAGLQVQLVNSRHARPLAGRPKTDQKDAQWIARLAEMGLLRPSLVPPPEIRALRDLTRTRLMLVRDRKREWQRLEKLLEGASGPPPPGRTQPPWPPPGGSRRSPASAPTSPGRSSPERALDMTRFPSPAHLAAGPGPPRPPASPAPAPASRPRVRATFGVTITPAA